MRAINEEREGKKSSTNDVSIRSGCEALASVDIQWIGVLPVMCCTAQQPPKKLYE